MAPLCGATDRRVDSIHRREENVGESRCSVAVISVLAPTSRLRGGVIGLAAKVRPRRVEIALNVALDIVADVLGEVRAQRLEVLRGYARRPRLGVNSLSQLGRPHGVAQHVIERTHHFVLGGEPEPEPVAERLDLRHSLVPPRREVDRVG